MTSETSANRRSKRALKGTAVGLAEVFEQAAVGVLVEAQSTLVVAGDTQVGRASCRERV